MSTTIEGGITFIGNDNKGIKKNLGDNIYIVGNDSFDLSKYSSENVITYNDNGKLRLAISQIPSFSGINIGGVTISTELTDKVPTIKFNDSKSSFVKLTGVAPGSESDSVVTKGQLEEAITGIGSDKQILKYSGNNLEQTGNYYSMDLQKDTFVIKGSNDNIVTTAKDNGVLEIDLGNNINIGDITIDGNSGSITNGNTLIEKDSIKTEKLTAGNVVIEGNTISGLADGINSNDAVNVRQLNAAIDTATDKTLGTIKINYEGNKGKQENIPLADGKINMIIKGESENRSDGNSNIISSVKDNGEVDLDLNESVVIGNGRNQIIIDGTEKDTCGGRIQVGAVEIKKDGMEVDLENGNKITVNNNGINAGKKQIKNVADGIEDSDVVTVKQLKEVSTMISDTEIKGTGAVIVTKLDESEHKGYNVHVDRIVQFTDKEGRDVVKSGDKFYIVKNGVVTSTSVPVKDIYTKLVNPDGSVTTPTHLGNVADGRVAPESKDAVNGGQLYNTNKAVADNSRKIYENVREIHDLRKEHNNGMAQMAAMSAVDFMHISPNKVKVGAGLGGHKGATAVAVGVAYAPAEHFVIDAKWSTATDTHRGSTFGIGATYEFNCD